MPAKSSSYKRENLRTVVETVPLNPQVTYADRIMLIGSCFTEHIGNRLKTLKFAIDLNPFGIVYNPLSIADQLQYLLNPVGFSRYDMVFYQDLWHSWIHHSRFSHPDAELLLKSINEQALASSKFLEQAGLLILTFGTSNAYYLKTNNRLVSNCHQLPADQFYSRQPDPQELADIWIPLIDSLMCRNQKLRICLTISPVRYFKDGPTGNQMSKSTLFLFIGILMKTYPDLYYFPSYEIFMDDLRDYRFYDTDMMHPGLAGVEYVWNRFVKAFIDPGAYPLMDEVESAVKGAHHRPGGYLTDAHRRFVAQQMDRISALQVRNPFLDFTEDLEILRGQMGLDQS
ncbi:MAG: GSCFA domain-containing protein [Bacteroidales bacterium]